MDGVVGPLLADQLTLKFVISKENMIFSITCLGSWLGLKLGGGPISF